MADRHPPLSAPATGRVAVALVATGFFALFLLLCHAFIRDAAWPGPFDELQHVSYAAALQERGSILPHFEEHRVLDPTDLSRWTSDRNYVGHPSPFYAAAALFLDRSLPPADAVAGPRLFSFLLIAAAVAASLVAGALHFGSSSAAFVTFCALVALCPIRFPLAAQVNNDALAIFAGALVYCGTFPAPRRMLTTILATLALAAGVVLALWAKPNAGLLVGAWAGAFALAHRSPRTLATVVAAGLFGCVPYLDILWRYGDVVPVTFEAMTGSANAPVHLTEYLHIFVGQFLRTWAISESGHPLALLAFAALTVCVAVGATLEVRSRGGSRGWVAATAALTFLAILAVHVAYGALTLGGSRGAASFRYYLPLWPMLAHAVALVAARLPGQLPGWALAGLAFVAVTLGLTV